MAAMTREAFPLTPAARDYVQTHWVRFSAEKRAALHLIADLIRGLGGDNPSSLQYVGLNHVQAADRWLAEETRHQRVCAASSARRGQEAG